MIVGTYRDLFLAIAGSAGALTGLLFVALSVAPRTSPAARPNVIREVRAAASLLSFTNALAVSLFGLVPHNEVGYPAAVMGVIGLLFTVAGARSIVADPAARSRLWGQLGLIVLLLAVFGIELVSGIAAIWNPRNTTAVDVIGNILAASLLIGVARSWELVGDRDTGIFTSIAVLAGHERHLGGSVAGPADVPRDEAADPREAVSPGNAAAPGTPAAGPGSPAPGPGGPADGPGQASPGG